MTGFTTIAFGAFALIAALSGSTPVASSGSWNSSSASFTGLDFWVE